MICCGGLSRLILTPCCHTRYDGICLIVPHLFHVGFDRAHVEFGVLTILSVKSGGLPVRVATIIFNPFFCGSEMPIDIVYNHHDLRSHVDLLRLGFVATLGIQ